VNVLRTLTGQKLEGNIRRRARSYPSNSIHDFRETCRRKGRGHSAAASRRRAEGDEQMRQTVTHLLIIIGFALTASAQTATSPNVTGSKGDVIVNGDPSRPESGVLLRAKAAAGSVAAQTGTALSDSGFLVFNSANSELLRVRSDGNVGIGTPAPRALLHLVRNNSSGIGPELILENNAGTVNDYMAVTFSDIAYARAQIRTGIDKQSAAGILTFATGVWQLEDRMIIKPWGEVRALNMNGHADLAVASGDNPGVAHSPMLRMERMNSNDEAIASYGFWVDPAGNKLKLVYNAGNSSRETPALLTIDPGTAGKPRLTFDGAIVGAVYQDLAEWVPATTDVPPGTVVVLNSSKTNEVMASSSAYDARVAGVVSEQPGILLGPEGDGKEMIATTGRVRVRVDATRPIRVGDLLVSSDKPGMAMKSEPIDVAGVAIHRPGTIIGKALEALDGGEGEILVLLSLQ
jgi:hypothetical protein